VSEGKRKVVITGHAIAPQGTVMFETKKLITVALEIEWETGIILNAESTFMTNLCNQFFREIVIGKNFTEDYEQIKEQVVRDIHIDSKKALLSHCGSKSLLKSKKPLRLQPSFNRVKSCYKSIRLYALI